ncbi:MAG: hypothetical protein A2157_05450 [Deltaproteobacteria bacterium RBG_16_47_11]|nr:MAG: hypothetical protein A2157_05450 [Deltaproteobacteria bacterium RBG_16_47_11]
MEQSIGQATESPRRQFLRLGMYGMIAALVGILYFNSLGNQFTNWDDGMIYQNPVIRNLSWKGIQKIFSYERSNTYQPIRMLSYAIDYAFWELDPFGYHLTNVFFYMFTCLCVCFTFWKLSVHLRENVSRSSHERVALLGGLLFAAHPVHVEAVAWLAARKEVLQGFFFFLAFALYLAAKEEIGRKRGLYLALVLLSILLAILSKPSAIVFPGVILVYEIAQRKDRWLDLIRHHWPFWVLAFFISCLFTYILMKVMLDAGGIKPYHGGTFFNNLLVSFYAFLYNLKLLIVTINYSASYTLPISRPILNPLTFVFVMSTLFLFGVSIWSLKKTKVFFFSFYFFWVTVLPYLNIIPISTLLADRYVFIASFSYCFLLGIGFDQIYQFRYRQFSEGFFKLLSVSLILFLLVIYSLLTMQQNRVWENSYTLWADAVEKYPESNTANALMGVVYMELGMDEKAARHLEKAVQILPYDYQSRNNLGIVYGRTDQSEKAIKEFIIAIGLKPDDDNIKINLSVCYQRQKDYRKAEEVLNYLLSKHPRYANLRYRKGLLYKEEGRVEDAISEFKTTIELAPNIINPYEELGNIYLNHLNDTEKAKSYFLKGIHAASRATSKVDELRWVIQDLESHR